MRRDKRIPRTLQVAAAFEGEKIGHTVGDIVRFRGDGSPLRALSISIDPVQDLHGYDAPWPGGGGKNKWHLYANGYYNSAGGFTPSGSNGCSDKIPVTVGATYVFGGTKATTEMLTLRGYFFDENDAIVGSQIAGSSGSKSVSFTAPSGAVTVALWFSESGWTDTMTQTECDRLGMQMETGSSLTTYAPYSNICPISGWSAANLWRTGKNLLDPDKRTQTSNNIRYYVADGFLLKSGQTYTLTVSGSPAIGLYFVRMSDNSNIALKYSDTKLTYTPTEDVLVKCNIYYSPAPSGGLDDIKCQLELASTATDYAPYTGTTIPVTWSEAGTVYGGTLDVVNGVLTVDRAEVDLGTLEWTYDSLRQYFRTSSFADIITGKQYSAIICDQYSTKAGVGKPNADCQIAQNSSGGLSTNMVNIKDTRYTDATVFTAALDDVKAVYELATPLTYTLTPQQLDTLAGQNVVWGDAGAVDLEYVCDNGEEGGKLALLLRNKPELLIAMRKGAPTQELLLAMGGRGDAKPSITPLKPLEEKKDEDEEAMRK